VRRSYAMQIPQTHGISLPLARFVLLEVDRLLSETPIRRHPTELGVTTKGNYKINKKLLK
jgi:hypothetical protein